MIRVVAEIVRTVKDGIVWASLLAVGLSLYVIGLDLKVFVRTRTWRYFAAALAWTGAGLIVGVIGQLVYEVPVIRLDFRTVLYCIGLLLFTAGSLVAVLNPSVDEREELHRRGA